MKTSATLLLLTASIAAAQTVAITDVTVINPRSDRIQAHQTVVVEAGQIRSVGAAAPPKGARIVNGRRKFLIPGLWDAHVHLTKTGALSLPMFIVNGVTGVRDMGSDLSEIKEWRKQIDAGKLIGPRIKTSGPILESRANFERMKREGTVEPVDRVRIGVATPDEGLAAVQRLAAAGVDHIKMRSTPDIATFRAVADEATRRNLPFTAHALAAPEELLGRLGSVEHFLAFPPLNDVTEPERRARFRLIAQAGLHLSNTMANLHGLVSIPYAEGKQIVEDSSGRVETRRRYLCGYLIDDWREQLEEGKSDPYEPLRKELPNLLRDFRQMREEGVPFLAGTDAGVLFVYPGFSLHDQLRLMVQDIGFTPMQVLRIATAGIPEFYGETKTQGSIAPGQVADMVLLDADPLADIRNTTRIAGVMTGGRWLDRTHLNRISDQVRRSARSGCKS